MPKQDTQLTTPETFNVKSVIFDPVQKRNVPDQDVAYHQATLKMKYPDGSEGPIILQLPRCPTFGVSNKYGDSADKLSLSIILGEKDNYSDEHKAAVKVIDDIVKACKDFTLSDEVKDKIGQYDLEERDLKDMTPLKFQRDKETKKLMSNKPPILNAKFKTRNNKETKSKEITSVVWLEGAGVAADPRDFISKSGYTTVLLQFESIYYGTKIKLQCKIYECELKSNETGFKSFLRGASGLGSSSKSSAFDEDVDTGSYEDDGAVYEDEIQEDKPAIMDEDFEEVNADQSEEIKIEEQKRPATPPNPKSEPPTKRRGTSKK